MEPMRMLDCSALWLGHIQVSLLLADTSPITAKGMLAYCLLFFVFHYYDLAWHYIFEKLPFSLKVFNVGNFFLHFHCCVLRIFEGRK